MHPQPNERYHIYAQLVSNIDRGMIFSMCPYIAGMIGYRLGSCSMYGLKPVLDLQIQFPELYEQRPYYLLTQHDTWWPHSDEGMQKRKQALLNAMKILKDAQQET